MSADHDYEDQLDELLEDADALGHGPAQVALVQGAVDLADSHGDTGEGFRCRMALINAAMTAGKPEAMLVAFSWCLARSDRDPATFSAERLLWTYRWVAFSLPLFPDVSRGQILSALDDMNARYQKAGSTLRAVHLLRRNVAMRMGDHAMGALVHEAWLKSARDHLSDSADNEQDFLVEYLVFAGQDEAALQQAQPLLTGRQRRHYEPTSTYPELLLPLLRLGRVEQAVDYHRSGFKLLDGKPHEHFLTEYADHLSFLALTDNWPRGVGILNRVLPAAMTTASIGLRFDFFLAARLFLHRLGQQSPQPIGMHVPSAFSLYDVSGRYDPKSLEDWFRSELLDLAGRFDARNGNGYFKQRIDDLDSLDRLACPCPAL